ncbi:hypothetical protein ES708_17934 [subsurface metagenome]
MTENLTNVAWKCRECGEITYHPSADTNAKIEIRTGTLCFKCLRDTSRRNDGVRESKSYC